MRNSVHVPAKLQKVWLTQPPPLPLRIFRSAPAPPIGFRNEAPRSIPSCPHFQLAISPPLGRRLVRLCEALLARELVAAGRRGGEPEVLAAAVAAAGPLLGLADEGGLDGLRGVALQFVSARA